METLDLSRIQFALNISFHILFPAISIGLAWFLVYFKFRVQFTTDIATQDLWMRCYRFWVKLFALTFALGVVSGITMSFQFGTNWPGFMDRVGNIAGPLLGYEVLTAFFMEATFLGIMLFGIHRVPTWVHSLATLAVAVGTTLSAFWIIALNSWMHTPTGFELRDAVAFPVSWWAIIFNPSMPYRLTHVLLASGLTSAFLVAGISSYRILRGDLKPAPRMALKTAIVVAAVLAPLQIFSGDLHGLNTLKHQPQKIAAMEGVWQTSTQVPFVLFAIPNEETRTNDFAISIPYATSLVLTHQTDGEVQGLDDFKNEHPPVKPVFFAFRIMIVCGLLMLASAWWGCLSLWRHGVVTPGRLKIFYLMTFSGWIATLAGWYVTEIGRQPYLVSGVLRTSEAVTDQPVENVAFSLLVYAVVYGFLLISYIGTLFYLAGKSAQLEADNTSTPAAHSSNTIGNSSAPIST